METRAIVIVGGLIAAIAAAILMATAAQATPRLAALHGQDCHLCHVNPTAGGMRTSFVTQLMAPAELAIKPLTSHEPPFLPSLIWLSRTRVLPS